MTRSYHSDDGFDSVLERKLIEQRTLSSLARSLSAVLDLDVLLTQVVEAAASLSNAEEALLLLPDEEGNALYIRAVKGIDSETARNFRIKTQDTLAGQVFRTGLPVIAGDQGWQKVKTEYLVKSLLYVPLSLKGQTVGVLGINNKNAERTFSEHDTELLQDLAAHAAIAIENARLYEESVQRTRELSMLVQAGEAANSTLAIGETLSIIAAQLLGALDVGQCYIGEWNAELGELDTLAVCYQTLWRPGEGPILSFKSHPNLEQVFRQRRIAFMTGSSITPDEVSAAWLPHHSLAQHTVYVPLFTQEHPLGLVTFYHLHPLDMDQNYRHSTQMQIQQLALEILVTLSSSDARQQQKNLFRSIERLLGTAGADWCEVAVWNRSAQQFDVPLSFGKAIWGEEFKPALRLDDFPQLARILTEQQPFTDLPEGELHHLVRLGYGKSMLGVPLIIKGQIAGLVLLVDTRHDHQFSRREVQLAQALVLQAANALDNARLFRDLELSLQELRRTQSKLVQTARLSAMGELAAAIAHQINNPLTTILGDAELILQDMPPEDRNHEALEAISRAGKRAHEVVRRLLAMARQQQPEDMVEALDINETINNTLMLVKSHIQQGNVVLSVRLDEALPPVEGIRGQLEDVWLNLLLNARDAVVDRPDPQIGIATKYQPSEDEVQVMIWDNGAGIPDELQKKVFEPFFTTKPTGEGTGLGLHICRQVVEKCQGSIRIKSTYDEGTLFLVQLPAYHKREKA